MAIQGPVSMSNLLELKSIIHGEFLYLLAAMRKLILRRVVILQHAKMVDWKISPIVTNEDEHNEREDEKGDEESEDDSKDQEVMSEKYRDLTQEEEMKLVKIVEEMLEKYLGFEQRVEEMLEKWPGWEQRALN